MEHIPSILMEHFFGKCNILFTDNYYTSPSSAMFFLQNHIHLCGTVRKNRKLFSKEVVNVSLHRGAAVFYKPSNRELIMVCKYCSYKDKARINKK